MKRKPNPRRPGRLARERAADPDNLTTGQRAFLVTYLADPARNATAAYRSLHPKASPETAATEGWRYLRSPEMMAALKREDEARWKRLEMQGDEAAARVALAARLDPRRFFNDKGELLKPHQWPDDIAGCVKGIAEGPYGLKLTIVDPLSAQRIVLELTGKIKGGVDAGELATLLAQHYKGDA